MTLKLKDGEYEIPEATEIRMAKVGNLIKYNVFLGKKVHYLDSNMDEVTAMKWLKTRGETFNLNKI